jgi:hypothetical protein
VLEFGERSVAKLNFSALDLSGTSVIIGVSRGAWRKDMQFCRELRRYDSPRSVDEGVLPVPVLFIADLRCGFRPK